MKKALLIVGVVVSVAAAGYVVYLSYFADEISAGSGYGANGWGNQLPAMPTTDEQKLDALNSLIPAPSASTDTVSGNTGNQTSNIETSFPKINTNTMEDEEKIRLLESLSK